MEKDTNYYFKKKKVDHFNILNFECRGDRLEETYKEHK